LPNRNKEGSFSMRCKCTCRLVLTLWVLSAVTAAAHHGFGSYFETDPKLIVKGVVTKLDWKNPHPYLFLDVKTASGTTESWSLEFSPIAALTNAGLTQDSIKPGDEISVLCYAARIGGVFDYLESDPTLPGSHAKSKRFGRAREVTLANGRLIVVPAATR
jgi:hypothetical protein